MYSDTVIFVAGLAGGNDGFGGMITSTVQRIFAACIVIVLGLFFYRLTVTYGGSVLKRQGQQTDPAKTRELIDEAKLFVITEVCLGAGWVITPIVVNLFS